MHRSGWLLLLTLLLFSFGSRGADTVTPIERPYISYYLDNPAYLPTIDSAVVRARTLLDTLLRDTIDYRPALYLVGNLQKFEQLVGSKFPDWGAAVAIPSKGRIVIKSPDHFSTFRPLAELVAHEYSHLALANRLGLQEAPRWLDEGLAMYTSMEWSWSNNLAMSKAAVFRQFVSLTEINQVNRFNASKAAVAYAESYVATKYFIDQYGINALNMLLDDVVHGRPLDSAMMAATGSTMAGFEKEFDDFLQQRYNVTSLFMDTFWFWTALAFVVVIGAFLSYRRKRKTYRKWEEEEKFHSTDFDYGNEDIPEKPDEDDDEAWRR